MTIVLNERVMDGEKKCPVKKRWGPQRHIEDFCVSVDYY